MNATELSRLITNMTFLEAMAKHAQEDDRAPLEALSEDLATPAAFGVGGYYLSKHFNLGGKTGLPDWFVGPAAGLGLAMPMLRQYLTRPRRRRSLEEQMMLEQQAQQMLGQPLGLPPGMSLPYPKYGSLKEAGAGGNTLDFLRSLVGGAKPLLEQAGTVEKVKPLTRTERLAQFIEEASRQKRREPLLRSFADMAPKPRPPAPSEFLRQLDEAYALRAKIKAGIPTVEEAAPAMGVKASSLKEAFAKLAGPRPVAFSVKGENAEQVQQQGQQMAQQQTAQQMQMQMQQAVAASTTKGYLSALQNKAVKAQQPQQAGARR